MKHQLIKVSSKNGEITKIDWPRLEAEYSRALKKRFKNLTLAEVVGLVAVAVRDETIEQSLKTNHKDNVVW